MVGCDLHDTLDGSDDMTAAFLPADNKSGRKHKFAAAEPLSRRSAAP